jgi:hypothetical protein
MKKGLSIIFILGLVLFLNVSSQAQKTIGKGKTVKTGKVSLKYNSADAFTDGNGVWIEWETEAESENLGFYVYRISNDFNERVNKGLVAGGYLRRELNSSGKYSYFDAQGDIGSVYYIQSLDINGRVINSKMISPQPVEDLAAVAGVSSEQLKKASLTANPDSLQSENELPDDLKLEVSQNATQADAVTQRWVAAQPGVKIGVIKEGIYRVSRAELQSAGFDVNASHALWQLYVDGVQQSINVGDGGAFIEFYGRGIDRLEANTQIYYLVVGAENGKRIGRTVRRPIGGQVLSSSFLQALTKKERFNYFPTPLNGDAENFYGTFITSAPVSVSFNLPAVDFTMSNASIEIGIQGLTNIPSHQTRILLNGVDIGSVTGSFLNLATRQYNIPTSYLRAGTNTLQLTSVGGTSDFNYFQSVKVSYARRYQAEQNQLSFYTNNYRASYLEGFTSPNIRVFDVTYPDTPTIVTGLPIELKGSDYRVFLPANRGRVMYAVEESAILKPASISANAPSNLSAAANSADLIIISYKDWIAQANDWADYRRSQGIIVKVVNIEDVFDEFNFGVVDSLSIRRFLQNARNNWQTAPRYVLLIGDATYDPKNNTGAGNFNFIPTKLVDTIYFETASDDTLTDFNDDGLADIPIGRVPARSSAEVTQLLNKTKVFEQTSAQGFSRGNIFASDLPRGWDFEGTSKRLSNLLPAANNIMVNRGETNAKAKLISEMNMGRFFINYAGHGSSAAWDSPNFFAKADAAALSNGNNLSVFTMLTCLNGYFHEVPVGNESLAEVLLKAPNGGAAAVWASTGDTTPDIQEIMATRFYQQLALGNLTRLGDLANDAKTVINAGRDVRLSWVLLGDPMLKVR